MLSWLNKKKDAPKGPKGYRAYAVGDVHGRLDLLNVILAKIEHDVERKPPRQNLLVMLGDLIDRGPDSRGVIERMRTYSHDSIKPFFLTGNHEEVLLRIFNREEGILANWLKFGGAECLESYGCNPADIDLTNEASALDTIRRAIPEEHARFIAGFADTLRFGDYLFVHAGVRPGIDLSLQAPADHRWIRSPFLEFKGDYGAVVVHGHSINPIVEERANRIGIDTGAYRTGILTALAVEGQSRWILDTSHLAETDPAIH
ncbi:MAG: metallophosphoesterase [Pseudomonadota bacterium]|nr:metallophosphoesterase [Pseudomonadota bacterium]